MSRATQGYAALRMASCTGLSPSVERLSRRFHSPCFLRYRGPTTPFRPRPEGFGLFPVRSPLLGESLLFSLPAGTKMFQFPAFASPIRGMTGLQPAGLSHSEIRGSKDICSYPRLIAAYHVLHRLHEPRHPPCALIHFLGSGHQHGRSYFQLYPDKQKCQENFFVEFYSTVSCVNMSKISWCQPGGKRRVQNRMPSGVYPHQCGE